jgi:hypothetical protein
MMGCCSSFKECSDLMACIYKYTARPLFKDLYDRCTYRQRLESGICFYGKNKTVADVVKNEVIPSGIPEKKSVVKSDENIRPKIYLICYKMPFAVFAKNNKWSYELNNEQVDELIYEFGVKNIPYRRSLDPLEDLPGDEVEVTGPCNSRIVFKVNCTEYHILNFNSHFIQSWFSEKICKAFISKGIESRVELIGPYSGAKSSINSITKDISSSARTKRPTNKESIAAPVQLTLFNLDDFAVPAYKH